jgi:phosphohistidine phosphatase
MTTPTTGGRTLILLRHAKAEDPAGKPDRDRGLAKRGRGDARGVGGWLSHPSRALAVDLVLCSTSERTRQTLDGVLAGGASAKDTRFDERIYDASAAGLLDLLREVPDSATSVLVIGHAPAIPVLASALAHEDSRSAEDIDRLSVGFPTCALAVLGFEGRWTALAPDSAYLLDFVVPRR